MRLEQQLYEISSKKGRLTTGQRMYSTRDLEYLSVHELYTGPLGNPLGPPILSSENIPMFSGCSAPLTPIQWKLPISPIDIKPLPTIEVRPLPALPSYEDRLDLETGMKGYKIFDPQKGGSPLTRLDFESHHGMPKMHMQHGEKDYFGINGDEAADILGEIYRKNLKIKFPWEE